MREKHLSKPTMIAAVILISLCFASCKKHSGDETINIAVFVPGILADSPIYMMMADGAREACDAYNNDEPSDKKEHPNHARGKAVLTISEAGTTQAQWGMLLTALAAEKKYDLILSSSPSIPSLIEPITKQFPAQKFILLDAQMTGCDSVAAAHFNQREQAYLAGFAAALSSSSGKIGLIAAQEYPIMNDVILPAYKEGAVSARSDTVVDFRIVGNWYDATKGAELARAMSDVGVDVIMPIAAGASQGVINTAKERGMRLVWADNADFGRAPSLITACAALEQERLAEEMTKAFLEGNVEWGKTRTLGAKEGYVRIVLSQDTKLVQDDMRAKVNEEAYRITSGELSLPQE